jgi:hypothetical protein
MSFAHFLPAIQLLSRAEKLQLIEFLARDLSRDECDVIEDGQSYPVWAPDGAFVAAANLMQSLKDEESSPRPGLH